MHLTFKHWYMGRFSVKTNVTKIRNISNLLSCRGKYYHGRKNIIKPFSACSGRYYVRKTLCRYIAHPLALLFFLKKNKK